MKRSLVVAAIGLWLMFDSGVQGQSLSPMRELIVQSDNVVLAEPADPKTSLQFKAIRVLLGTSLKEGDLFEVVGLDARSLNIRGEDGAAAPLMRPNQVLLCLARPSVPVARILGFPLTPLGLRMTTAHGGVYYSTQVVLAPRGGSSVFRAYPPGFSWDALLAKAAADATEVRHLRSLSAIEDGHRRNVELLDWVERHRREFGGGMFIFDDKEPTSGWGSLEQDVFLRIWESRIPKDCWAAIRVYAELYDGSIPTDSRPFAYNAPAFGSQEGRRCLLAAAADEVSLYGDRIRALKVLGLSQTLWPATPEARSDDEALKVEAMADKEQTDLIDALLPFLTSPETQMRIAAARALKEASVPEVAEHAALRTQHALPALIAAYRELSPGEVRNAVAEAVAAIASPERWREMTGNARGIVAVLDAGCRQGTDVYGWVRARPAAETINKQLMVILERLDDKQKVAEKKERPLEDAALSTSTHEYLRMFDFSTADLTPGQWRMTIKGTAGPDKAAWTSEPRLLHLTPPPKPEQPNFNPSAPRIVFDP